MNNVLIGAGRTGTSAWVYYETVAGGQGGRRRTGVPGGARRGMSGVHTGMTNTRNTPIEALERAFPMRVRPAAAAARQRWRRARRRAATASSATSRCSSPCTVSLITERRVSRPWGLAGGGDGAVGENWLLPGGDESAPSACPTSARSSSPRATCSGCSPPAAAAGVWPLAELPRPSQYPGAG